MLKIQFLGINLKYYSNKQYKVEIEGTELWFTNAYG